MTEANDWKSQPLQAAGNYVSELASDIWRGEGWSKHPTAMAVGTAALTIGGAGAFIFSARCLRGIAAGTMLEAEGATVSRLAQAGSEAGVVKEFMAPSLFERVMAQPGAEYATRAAAGSAETPALRIFANSKMTEQALNSRAPELAALGRRSEMSAEEYVSDLLKKSTKSGSVDGETYIGRHFNGSGRLTDVVVRADQNMAIEQVLKATSNGQLELKAWNILDFASGEARTYEFIRGQGALRTTVARDTARATWLSEDGASSEVARMAGNLFYQSNRGRDITGFHQILSQL